MGLAASLLGSCSSSSGTTTDSSTSSSTGASSTTGSTVGSATSAASGAESGAQWTTYYRDAARSGLAPDGPLSPAVRQLWTSPTLDGDVYAQPLLVGDRVVTATENDSVYSLNASDGTIAWMTHLGEPVPGSSLPCGNVDPVGVTGTPVIDMSARRVLRGWHGPARPTHALRARPVDRSTHRLDPRRRRGLGPLGAEPAWGVGALERKDIRALRWSLRRLRRLPRPCCLGGGLELGVGNGRVAYLLPTLIAGGFWSPPGAVVAADGTIYLTSGNTAAPETYDYANSVVRLDADLKLADSFAPSDWPSLNKGDIDLGSTSPVLLPNGRVFQVGKSGIGYLLDAEHLGGVGGQLHFGSVCQGSAFGGIAHDGDTMYVPCSDGVVQVTVEGDSFGVGWTTPVATPGPTIIAGGAVWTVATSSGDLFELDPSSGSKISSQHIGPVPSRFTSPAAGAGRVIVAAARTLLAFGA